MIAVGAQLSVGGASITSIVETAAAYEEAGIESVWVGDHLLDYYDPQRSTPECFTTLAAIARSTRVIRFGSLVASVLFRHPALFAKTAASLAELSSGRFELGLGAGGVKHEHLALGFEFPQRGERARRVENTLRALKELRDGGSATLASDYEGDVWCRPPMGSTPIVVGALHPRVGRSAGRYADEVNVIDYAQGPDVEAVLDAADAVAEEMGRTIRHSVLVPALEEPLLGGRHPRAGLQRASSLGAHRLIYRLVPPYPSPDRVLAGEA